MTWAIDLGTTHTRIARWDAKEGQPRLVELPEVCLPHRDDGPLEGVPLIPSATHLLDRLRWRDRIGDWPWVERFAFIGRQALMGQQALKANIARIHSNFAPSFKLALMDNPWQILARTAKRRYNARDVAEKFLRELLVHVEKTTGERIRDAVFTVPVDAYERYRAELSRFAKELGIRKVQFIDEPVAAAIGYGLASNAERLVLVVDFGGGTLHMALVALEPRQMESGRGRVLGKVSRAIGGTHVDRWLLAKVGEYFGFPLKEDTLEDDESQFWSREMLREACRIKEAVYYNDIALYRLPPPAALRRPGRRNGDAIEMEFTRDDLSALLKEQGLYQQLQECLDELEKQTNDQGLSLKDVDEVLMVGGSTLLPGVYPIFEERFGRDRVRAWQPFEAAVFGACVYGTRQAAPADFIVHDYAFVTHHPVTHAPDYTVIVPKGTRFPTSMELWKRRLVPTCAFGEPETIFKLVICEIGQAEKLRKFAWDASGLLHRLSKGPGGQDRLVVPLNESNPALGTLDPPHQPGDRTPRLEVSFGVNTDRWLCASVFDLVRRRFLMREEPVVRLL